MNALGFGCLVAAVASAAFAGTWALRPRSPPPAEVSRPSAPVIGVRQQLPEPAGPPHLALSPVVEDVPAPLPPRLNVASAGGAVSRVWSSENEFGGIVTCSETPVGRFIVTDSGRAAERVDHPSDQQWAQAGCLASQPRLISREEFARRLNADMAERSKPLKFEDLRARIQALIDLSEANKAAEAAEAVESVPPDQSPLAAEGVDP